MKHMRIFVHTGHLSFDNGAEGPLSKFFDLAGMLGVPADTGMGYYDDSLTISEAEWPTLEELLVELKMVYKVKGVHDRWQNVQTEALRKMLDRVAA